MVSTQTPHVPGYDVGEPLGEGASATVWRARRRSDGLAVALKVVHPERGDVEAALREAGLLAGIRHRHVVHLYDVVPLTEPGERDPRAVALVTQLAQGGSLAQLLARRRMLSPGELVTVLHPVAGAAADLHEEGVVHGDISTGNIVFRPDGMPLLADLGTSRVAGEASGQVWGTGAAEGLVAPEVLEGFPPTRESDVYQLGALAWLALVGEPPGPGLDRPAFAEVAPELAPGLVELVARCMASQPEDRPDAEELAALLLDIAVPEPVEVAPDADPAHGLTRRLRQVAQEDAAASAQARPRRWWQRLLRWPGGTARDDLDGHRKERADGRSRERPEVPAGESGAPAGRAAGAGPGEHRPERVAALAVAGRRGGQDPGSGQGEAHRSGPWVVATLFLASAVVGAVLYVLLWTPLQALWDRGPEDARADRAPVGAPVDPDESTATDDQAAGSAQTAVGDRPGPGAADAARPTSGGAATPVGVSAPVPSLSPQGQWVVSPGAARDALQQVVDARAEAWEASDPDLLGAALAPDSPARAADGAELGRAQEEGISYPEVDFDVGDVEVLEAHEDRLVLSATLVRGPLEVRDDRGWLLRTPEQRDLVELELVRSGDRWLLWSWGGEPG